MSLDERTDEELAKQAKEKLDASRALIAEGALLEEEQEIREEATKINHKKETERLKVVAGMSDNKMARTRLEEEFKQLCQKHASLHSGMKDARRLAEEAVKERMRKRDAKEEEKIEKQKTG